MSLLDRFKKTQPAKQDEKKKDVKAATSKASVVEKKAKQDDNRPKTIGEELAEKTVAKKVASKPGVYAHRVLLKPVVSEKTARLHSLNQYVFRIAPEANKIMVRKAIMEAYNLEPRAIHIIRTSGKSVTRGKITGRTRSYKKAVVIMPKGVTLPVYEGV